MKNYRRRKRNFLRLKLPTTIQRQWHVFMKYFYSYCNSFEKKDFLPRMKFQVVEEVAYMVSPLHAAGIEYPYIKGFNKRVNNDKFSRLFSRITE